MQVPVSLYLATDGILDSFFARNVCEEARGKEGHTVEEALQTLEKVTMAMSAAEGLKAIHGVGDKVENESPRRMAYMTR